MTKHRPSFRRKIMGTTARLHSEPLVLYQVTQQCWTEPVRQGSLGEPIFSHWPCRVLRNRFLNHQQVQAKLGDTTDNSRSRTVRFPTGG